MFAIPDLGDTFKHLDMNVIDLIYHFAFLKHNRSNTLCSCKVDKKRYYAMHVYDTLVAIYYSYSGGIGENTTEVLRIYYTESELRPALYNYTFYNSNTLPDFRCCHNIIFENIQKSISTQELINMDSRDRFFHELNSSSYFNQVLDFNEHIRSYENKEFHNLIRVIKYNPDFVDILPAILNEFISKMRVGEEL